MLFPFFVAITADKRLFLLIFMKSWMRKNGPAPA